MAALNFYERPCSVREHYSPGGTGAIEQAPGIHGEDDKSTIMSPMDNEDTCGGSKLLSFHHHDHRWDNAAGVDEEETATRQLEAAILRLEIGNEEGPPRNSSNSDALFDDFETRLRVEQERRDYLARELCLSQSRLAQLCAKNLKVYNVQQEHRRHCGGPDHDDYRSTTQPVTAEAADFTSATNNNNSRTTKNGEENYSHQRSSPSSQQQPQQRKSLSALHKERKLKELAETSTENSNNNTNVNSLEISDKVHNLRKQALQSVLADILAGATNVTDSTGLADREIVRVSPESGYNSSSSLKSPSLSSTTFPIVPVATACIRQQRASQPGSGGGCEFDLSASRERILEQVRNRRASAPPNQHVLRNCPSTDADSPIPAPAAALHYHGAGTRTENNHRPLKSILKKRATDTAIIGSAENQRRIGREGEETNSSRHRSVDILVSSRSSDRRGPFALRSSSYDDYGQCKVNRNADHNGQCDKVAATCSAGTDSSYADERQCRKLIRDTITNEFGDKQLDLRVQTTIDQSPGIMEDSSSDSTTSPIRPAQSPVPMPSMAERPGPWRAPSDLDSSPKSCGVAAADYPSPTKNDVDRDASGGRKQQGDLPDVVMLKIGGERSPTTKQSDEAVASPVVMHTPHHSLLRKEESSGKPTTFLMQTRVSSSKDSIEEYDLFRDWDPRPLVRELYMVRYEERTEEKRHRFVNMEGELEHLPMNVRAVVASEKMWRTHYFRTKEGRLQWFEDNTDSFPFGEMTLAGCDIDADKNAYTFLLKNPKEGQILTVRYPPHLMDNWRSALLSHASAGSSTDFVKPVYPPMPSPDQKVVVLEIGSCSIRAGVLTADPSLPQSYFPSIACVLPGGEIVTGFDALSPSIRHEGSIIHPIKPTQPAVSKYSVDLEIVKHLFNHAFRDLAIDSRDYEVMLSVPQNAPVAVVGDMMRMLLSEFGVRGLFVSKQPFLVLYSYDVTTGVVVDFGDRLNIVPVIDGYVVQSAIISLPCGGHNVSDGLRIKLIERNWTPYSLMSQVEKYILRYIMEQTCYVAADFDEESKLYDQNPSEIDTYVSMEKFNPATDTLKEYNVDSCRFTSPEGVFKPKRWGFDMDGLHKLVYNAIQASPLDSRRVLYRNIYLAGGASMLPGLAERLELELAPLVASSVQVRVRTSPWRDHAAYIGAQIIAGGIQFEQQLIKDTQELEKFIRRLYTANF